MPRLPSDYDPRRTAYSRHVTKPSVYSSRKNFIVPVPRSIIIYYSVVVTKLIAAFTQTDAVCLLRFYTNRFEGHNVNECMNEFMFVALRSNICHRQILPGTCSLSSVFRRRANTMPQSARKYIPILWLTGRAHVYIFTVLRDNLVLLRRSVFVLRRLDRRSQTRR